MTRRGPMMDLGLTAVAGFLAVCAVSGVAQPRTWQVNAAGTGDAPTIQEAIGAADEGDSVLVGPGTYTGPGNRDIEFHGKAISLIGTSGPAETILDCQGRSGDPHRGFHLHEKEGPATRISGFTVTNGYVEGHFPASYGGAILCERSSPTITDCWLIGNRSVHFGGGMVCYQKASPTLTRVRFIDNVAENNGGGFGSKMKCDPRLTDVLFIRNKAKRGGGLWCWNSAATVDRATFYGNEGTVSTGGIWSSEAKLTIRNTIISFSKAGKAIACTNPPPEVRVRNCDLFGNAGGDEMPDCVVDQGGNFSLDPLFANPSRGGFSLRPESPCAPGNHPEDAEVGWIGAREEPPAGR